MIRMSLLHGLMLMNGMIGVVLHLQRHQAGVVHIQDQSPLHMYRVIIGVRQPQSLLHHMIGVGVAPASLNHMTGVEVEVSINQTIGLRNQTIGVEVGAVLLVRHQHQIPMIGMVAAAHLIKRMTMIGEVAAAS